MDITASRTQPKEFSRRLFKGLPHRYNHLASVLSFGQDPRWRNELLGHMRVDDDATVLDVACGPAAVTCGLAAQSGARIVGLDLSPDMLAAGAANVEATGLGARVAMVLGRGEQLPFGDGAFDALSFTYLLRYVPDPDAALRELARVVVPGGPIASLEFAVPPNPLWRALWRCYTRLVLPVGGLALGGRAWLDVGRFLGPSIDTHYAKYPVDWTLEAWRRAGIEDVACRSMSLGGGIVIWGTRAR